MKMTELKTAKNGIIHLNPLRLLASAWLYVVANPLFCLCLLVTNWAYLLIFKAIHGGISNPLSLLWLIGYYIFWCVFYRYYYGLRPYFFFKAISGSLRPSTKAMLLLFLIMLIIAFMPMVPLLLGYDELYLDFYERYMQALEGLSGKTAPLSVVLLIYFVFSLLAPPLICKPYMSWIASLCRRSLSFAEAGDRLRGNYWKLVFISFVLVIPEAMASEADKLWQLQDWFNYGFNALLFVYVNIVFAKMYDLFYVKN